VRRHHIHSMTFCADVLRQSASLLQIAEFLRPSGAAKLCPRGDLGAARAQSGNPPLSLGPFLFGPDSPLPLGRGAAPS
jgi:hypothetical protein